VLRIAETFKSWSEIGDGRDRPFSRIVTREEIAKNDYNISPSRYIHTGEADEYRPIAEIVEELDALEQDAAETNARLKTVLQTLLA
jgi:type I restriction enzyme M protein